MLGFGRKSKAGKEKKAQRAETRTEQTEPPPVPLRLREPGGLLAPQPPPDKAPLQDRQTEQKPVFSVPKKTKLHLMTGREEKERAFQVAREHYLSKNLPSVRQENRRKERSHAIEYVTDRLIAVVGFFLIVCGWIWLYHHSAELETWWKSLLDSIRIL